MSLFKSEGSLPCERHSLRVRAHVLLQVVFPDERSLAQITLQLLGSGVDHHV